MALGSGAALTHRAAGGLWTVVAGPVPTEVVVPRTAGHGSRDGIIVHRALLRSGEVTVVDGIPVTSLVRTMLDLAAVLTPRELDRAFEEAQVRHGLAPQDLAVALVTRPHRRGNAALGRLLEDAVDPDEVRSILELRFLKLCVHHGIPRPLVNEMIGPWRPDFRWEAERLVVETDGMRFHRTAAKRRRDAAKDAYMREQGYAVLRFTWTDVTENPSGTASVIRANLADRATNVT